MRTGRIAMLDRPRFAVFAVTTAVLLHAASGARALEPAPTDWTPLAEVQEIQVLSENPDATPRETTVWLAVVDGQGFIRTGNTSWYPNLEQRPNIGVRVAGAGARGLAARGARGVAVDVNGEGGRAVAREIGGLGVPCEVGREADIE